MEVLGLFIIFVAAGRKKKKQINVRKAEVGQKYLRPCAHQNYSEDI
jgi:hypothetical protein